MGKLFEKYKVYPEITESGEYYAEIADIKQTRSNLTVVFNPYDERKGKRIRLAQVFLKITESNRCYSGAASFIDIFEEYDYFEDIIGCVVGIEVKVVEGENRLFQNVVNVFVLEDEDDEELENDTAISSETEEDNETEEAELEEKDEIFSFDEEDEF